MVTRGRGSLVPRVVAGLGLGLAACGDPEVVVRPVIELPVDDPAADPFTAPAIDELAVSVARAGSERDLVAQTFLRGEELALPGAPFGEDLVIHVTGFAQGGATAYGRTCVFAVDADGADAAPHLHLARTVRFGSLGVAPFVRSGGAAVALGGAAVLLGGRDGAGPVVDVERFDPATGQLVVIGQLLARTDAVAATLGTSPPRIVVVGGQLGVFGASVVEVVTPGGAVEAIDDVRMARLGITATSLTDGRVIAIGGHPPGGQPLGTITEVAAVGPTLEIRDTRAVLAEPRTGHTATRLGDDLGAPVLIAGGTTGVDGLGPPVAVAELYKPLTAELAQPSTFAPQMLVPRSRHQAVRMPDGSVLFVGGLDAAGNPVRTLELFSLDGGFVAVGELPAQTGVLDATVTVLADGRVLIAGGRTAPGAPATDFAAIARLDPLDGSVDVVSTDRLAVPRAGHQAALLCDGTVFVSGGVAAAIAAERYNPPATARR